MNNNNQRNSMLIEDDAVQVMEEYGWSFYSAIYHGKKNVFQFMDLDGQPVSLNTEELITKAAKVLKGEFGNKIEAETGMKVTKHKPEGGVTCFELKW